MPPNSMISVIIPTRNEAVYLPQLLDALTRQTYRPHEIIVADANSTDGTPEIAQRCGARLVPGGRPAVGRNAGARAARGNLLLFLDADVLPLRRFIEDALRQFHALRLDAATALLEPLSSRLSDHLIHQAANAYLRAEQSLPSVLPRRAPGCCILVRRPIHEAIGGFDESLYMAEDHDYVQRVRYVGRFGVLTTVRIHVSVRRLDREGVGGLAAKYAWVELQTLLGRPVRSAPFDYLLNSWDIRARTPVLRRQLHRGKVRAIYLRRKVSRLYTRLRTW